MIVKISEAELNNLLAFLLGRGRINLDGSEAIAFANIIATLQGAEKEEVKADESNHASATDKGAVK